jgi:hypothetical protein
MHVSYRGIFVAITAIRAIESREVTRACTEPDLTAPSTVPFQG